MKFEKKQKSILFSVEFSHGLRRALTFGLALIYFIYLGFDIVWVTTLFAVSTIIMTFFEFPTSAIADYDSRKKSILISTILMTIGYLGIFLFTNLSNKEQTPKIIAAPIA